MEKITIDRVRDTLWSLGHKLEEAEAIGIFGSLARGWDFGPKSDIDVFVVLKDKKPGVQTDLMWSRLIRNALARFERDVTVITYTLKGLREISNWYVLRLASEGIIIFDKGGISELFQNIVKAAIDAGLEERELNGYRYWAFKDIRLGEVKEIRVRD